MAKALARIFWIGCLIPCISLANGNDGFQPSQDSVTRAASKKYSNMNFFKRLFLGRNYRKEWAQPVRMPVFNVKTAQGGLTPGELGGGQQTKSLRLKDKNGQEWVLRTVDKTVDFEQAIKSPLRKTFVKKLVQDMVSASHPYAALTIPELAKAAKVVAANPKLYFVPNDPALGEHHAIFANTVCMLEEREPTPDHSETENTEKVLEEIMEENDHLVMQEQVLRARLLDMLVADWDRHADQWRWGLVDSGDTKHYYAIPRDRDFAYFHSRGLLVKIMSKVSLQHMRGFTPESKGLKKLNKKTWFFDHNFLNELDAGNWKRIIAEFQQNISDDVISRAIKRIPPEVYAISGNLIESKLKTRRDGLMKNAMKYYEELAESVHVMGTDKSDLFRVTNEGDDLSVAVYDYDGKKKGRMTYQRVFKRSETHEIFLEGFGDDDHFEIEEGVDSKIRLMVNGGNGKDSLTNRGKIREKLNGIETEGDKTALSKNDRKK
ncbi:MAG TPA: hypothetical protein VGD17_03870 [Chitinophagaceae bacterium]